ncbi:Nucleic acid-binding, OB-fold [Acididesulfobacillus acetoxydans]|uniref:Nucleic acid-binding, OB-fold n=1 Tax=Acididesulfobacillus acetoxydans TaxID=1561005 RepID=A0A8S0XA13_9FIRM|nr:Nucleic acid-binding, OB-fold [Acididesulfobacillus acetoxydans]
MREIILQGQAEKLRAALFEDNELVEVFEGEESGGLVGNIYLGRVENVLPGMQAAFVDIGLEKTPSFTWGMRCPPVLWTKKSGRSSRPTFGWNRFYGPVSSFWCRL